jgi:hypothetical protein
VHLLPFLLCQHHPIKPTKFIIDLLLYAFDAVLQVLYTLIVFLYVDVGLSDIFHEIAGVVAQFHHHLQCLVVLEDTIREMPHEVIFAGVAMQLVYNPHLFVDLMDIFGSLVLWNLYV